MRFRVGRGGRRRLGRLGRGGLFRRRVGVRAGLGFGVGFVRDGRIIGRFLRRLRFCLAVVGGPGFALGGFFVEFGRVGLGSRPFHRLGRVLRLDFGGLGFGFFGFFGFFGEIGESVTGRPPLAVVRRRPPAARR
jgi:hypothetical protein